MEMVTTLLQDFRQALRRLRATPGFAGLAIVTLALAIGAHAAIFNLIDVVFLRPLPVAAPERLVGVYESRDGTGFHPLSLPDYHDYRDATTVFAGLAAHYAGAPLMAQIGDGAPEEINGSVVSANYFPLLGVDPARGRFFLPAEDSTPGVDPVAVVSHRFWQTRLGGREEALGTVVKLNGTAFTVIGVAPERFEGVVIGLPSEVWIPTASAAVGYRWCDTASRDCTWIDMIGRLAPGRTVAEAQAEMDVLSRRLRAAHPSGSELERGLAVAPLTGVEPAARLDRLRLVTLLLAAVTLVVVVAGANLSGLLIARGLARHGEVAVRTALGAPAWRVVSPFVAETLLLALAGGAGGLVVAAWLGRLVALFYPSAVPLALGFSPAVAAYTAGLAVLIGLLVGLVPGLQASRPSLVAAIKGEATTGGRHRPRLLGSLVVVQVAVSFLLLTATGLMVRSLAAVSRIGSLDPDRVATLRLRPRLIGYDAARAQPFTRAVMERLSGLPGVESATLAAGLPPRFWYDGPYPAGRPGEAPDPDRGPTAWTNWVGPRFFATFAVPLLRGRDFDGRDTAASAPATVVNRTLATALWPQGEAVGQLLVLAGETYEVIGVVEDPPALVAADRVPQAYLAYWQDPEAVDARIAVRTTGAAGPLLPGLRAAIRAVDPEVPVVETETMRGRLRRAFAPAYLTGRLLGVTGALSLFLSAVGLFGVVALAVAQRAQEIGIRQALGGSRRHVVALVVRDTLVLVAVALGLGLAASLALDRTLAHYLYGVSPRDPLTVGSTLVALALVAALASWWPARRATRIDPIVALRRG
jgi:putative ABC transport system permease protein